MNLIELDTITKTFRNGDLETPVLHGISLELKAGEHVALTGTSGSGKTTLMNILGCLDRPTSGGYRLLGKEISQLSSNERARMRNRSIGFVFQNFNLLPRTTALDNVLMPLSYSEHPLPAAEAKNRAIELLKRLELGDRMTHEPARLSGGQQQRVAIARALINRPALLLADEPTGNLDSKTTEDVLGLFRELNEQEGITIVLVTHEAEVSESARRVIRIRDGIIESDQLN